MALVRESFSRLIRRLNLHGLVMKLPIFGKALYDGLSMEFERVNDFREKVKVSVVPNADMDHDSIDDYEEKYGIIPRTDLTNETRIDRIMERAARNGSGGPDWLEDQIQKAGFPLYVHMNTQSVLTGSQYGVFQYGQRQYGISQTYIDPAGILGELIVASPNGNIGGQYRNYGTFQYGTAQFGELIPGFAYPRPREYSISTNPNVWGYFFFLSPFESALATVDGDLLQLSQLDYDYLFKTVIQIKHARNWCIAQVKIV